MGNLKYARVSPDRVRDVVEGRDFIAVSELNARLEQAAITVQFKLTRLAASQKIRALKEPV